MSEELDEFITELAKCLLEEDLGDRFRNLANEKSKFVSVNDLPELKNKFHKPPKESSNYDQQKHGLGGWLSACQFAIFELIFNLGEDALPFVREIAWGKYDWTQGNAIELLIRFASNGIRHDEIVKEIKTNYPTVRYEAQLYAIQPLIHELKKDENLQLVFNELLEIKEFRECFDELNQMG